MDYRQVIKKLESLASKRNVEGMARFGIRPKAKVLGVSLPFLRKIAKDIKKDHKLAQELWDSGIHEAKILASIIADKEKLTEKIMNKWVKDFDSWDIVDQTCMNLFGVSKFADKKIFEWAKNKEEFIRRTAFSLMAVLAVKNKEMKNADFLRYFELIKKYSTDERNFVKKAVNWALRQIGKRNKKLNKEAIKLAKEIGATNSKPAKWIASNALSELTNKKYQNKLK